VFVLCRLVSENQKAIRDFVRSVRVNMDERDTALVAEQNATLLVRPHRRRIFTYRRLFCCVGMLFLAAAHFHVCMMTIQALIEDLPCRWLLLLRHDLPCFFMVQPLPSATLSAFCKEREEALAKDFRVSYLAYQVHHPLLSPFHLIPSFGLRHTPCYQCHTSIDHLPHLICIRLVVMCGQGDSFTGRELRELVTKSSARSKRLKEYNAQVMEQMLRRVEEGVFKR
jgi:hypothetical protein